MAGTASTQNAQTRGYLSQEHKKTYTVTVGVLGALFFFAQFVVPFIIMLAAMPAMMASSAFSVRDAHPSHSAYWKGKIWYPETTNSFGKSEQPKSTLKTMSFAQQQEPARVDYLPFASPWLLAGNDRLWVIASNGIGYYRDGSLSFYHDIKPLGDISRPLIYNGVPALVEDRPGGLAFMVFRDNSWQEEFALPLMSGKKLCCISDLQILSNDSGLHIFLKYGDSLYYREGLSYSGKEREDAWQAISPAVGNWYAVLLEGEPAVFINAADGTGTVTGYRKTGGRWAPFFTHQSFITSELGAFAMEGTDRVALLTEGFPGSLSLLTIHGRKIVGKTIHGSSFPFPKSFMLMMFIPQGLTMLLPVILAVIFSALMRKHRVGFLQVGRVKRPFASLTRRALAQIVDAVILCAPFLVIWLKFMSSFFEQGIPFFMKSGFLPMIALMMGGLFWALFCVVVFSIMEGTRGVTPGKWVFGIRVLGTELRYCGFWRALVRNLLKFVDGFFNFMVGVMVVAFSENWQRVGDMAARTVVVDVRRGRILRRTAEQGGHGDTEGGID